MSGFLFCNIIGYAALIASFIVPRFKFKDDRAKYAIGLTLASFSLGVFITTMILR
jgi:hypothetical protein